MDRPESEASAFYTTKQVADLLGVSAPTVIKWVKEGRIEAHVTPGGHRRIAFEALQHFADTFGLSAALVGLSHHHEAGSGLRVMVIDPEPDYSDVVSEYFRLQGSVHVSQPLEPLRVGYEIGRFKPHVIVFDVSTPRVPVREILQLANEQRSVRVVLLSSNWNAELRGIAEDFDFVDMVQKPVKLDILWGLVGADRLSQP